MVGYWTPGCPVVADRKDVLATVYCRPGKALVAMASWAPRKVECRLKIDWSALGMDGSQARFRAPAVERL